jgi:hypothetical protein
MLIGKTLPLSHGERGKDTFRWLGVSELKYDKKFFSSIKPEKTMDCQ